MSKKIGKAQEQEQSWFDLIKQIENRLEQRIFKLEEEVKTLNADLRKHRDDSSHRINLIGQQIG